MDTGLFFFPETEILSLAMIQLFHALSFTKHEFPIFQAVIKDAF